MNPANPLTLNHLLNARRAPLFVTAAVLLIADCLPCAAQQKDPPNTAPAANDSVDEIERWIATEKAQALEAYLAAHPNASDATAALSSLYMCYRNTGDVARQLKTLERNYSVISKSAGQEADGIGFILYPMIELLVDSEQVRDLSKAEAMIERAKKEFAGHANTEKGKSLFAQLEGMLNRPVVGGTLEIAFTALDGTEVDLAAMKGKVVLVDFWATWCAPCVASQPEIKKLYEKFHGKGFEVIGISLDSAESKTQVQNFVKKKNLAWPQAFSGKGWDDEFAAKCGLTGIPATFLIGKDGRIAAIGAGGHDLEVKVEELLK
jgi:peroxiredoxin